MTVEAALNAGMTGVLSEAKKHLEAAWERAHQASEQTERAIAGWETTAADLKIVLETLLDARQTLVMLHDLAEDPAVDRKVIADNLWSLQEEIRVKLKFLAERADERQKAKEPA